MIFKGWKGDYGIILVVFYKFFLKIDKSKVKFGPLVFLIVLKKAVSLLDGV